MNQPLRTIPLHEEHLQSGARMGPFAGWEMPIQYGGIIAEHQWTRENASLFDIYHMGEFELSGPTAFVDLNALLTCKLTTLQNGQCRYGYMLNENAGVIDDLTIYKCSDDRFMLVVNAGNRALLEKWIRPHLQPATQFTDRSDGLAKLDVQGPKAREALEAIGGHLPDLRYFRFEEIRWMDLDLLISRTGYTGEFGYELYFPSEESTRVWKACLSHDLIKPAGLGARDTLRLEVGYPLHGHELRIDANPAGVCQGMFVDQTKDYIGKEFLEKELRDGPEDVLIGLTLEGRRAAREGDTILFNGNPSGTVTSGSYGPSVGSAIVLGIVSKGTIGQEGSFEVHIRGKAYPAQQTDLPFYKSGTVRG